MLRRRHGHRLLCGWAREAHPRHQRSRPPRKERPRLAVNGGTRVRDRPPSPWPRQVALPRLGQKERQGWTPGPTPALGSPAAPEGTAGVEDGRRDHWPEAPQTFRPPSPSPGRGPAGVGTDIKAGTGAEARPHPRRCWPPGGMARGAERKLGSRAGATNQSIKRAGRPAREPHSKLTNGLQMVCRWVCRTPEG